MTFSPPPSNSRSPSRRRGWLSLAALVAVALAACGGTDTTTAARPWPDDLVANGSTILLGPEEALLWLTSPDDDAVIAVDAETLEVVERIDVVGAPEQLSRVEDLLVVSRDLDSALTLIDVGAREAIASIPTGCSATRGVVALSPSDDRRLAAAACPHEDQVVLVDLNALVVVATIATPPRPSALTLAGGDLLVSSESGGVYGAAAAQDAFAGRVERFDDVALDVAADRSATRFTALTTSRQGRVAGTFQVVDNDSDRQRPPEQGGYGSVFDDRPRIAPRVLTFDGACAGEYARFDGGLRVFSGPGSVAWAGSRLLVVNEFTQNVAVLDCDDAERRGSGWAATYLVGPGARGVAVSSDGTTAFVDVGFDHSVARLDLEAVGAGPHLPALVLTRSVEPIRLSEAALRGRSLFHDATNTHLTPSGIVACATCHPRGGDDGLVWFIHTPNTPRKLRRTAPAWNARTTAAPFHWDGEFADGASLATDTIVELMGGDALVIDTSAIAAYMDEVPLPPPVDSELVDEGRALFMSPAVGCVGCHRGDNFSDNALHSVVGPSLDPDGDMPGAITRPLRGVRTRGPWLHDGRAATLRDVFTTHNPGDRHGTTSQLDPRELDALEAFLRSL